MRWSTSYWDSWEAKSSFGHKTCNIVLDKAFIRPITAAAHIEWLVIIWGEALMKSFVGFRQLAAVRCLLEVCEGRGWTNIFGWAPEDWCCLKRPGYAINILKGRQTLAIYTPDGLTCQWNVFSGGVGSSEVKWHENSAVFFLFFFWKARKALLGMNWTWVTPNSVAELPSSSRYDIREGIDEKFRGFSAIGGGSATTGMIRGGWSGIFHGARQHPE